MIPAALQLELAAHDYDRPGKPVCAWDDPQATQALVSGLVNDALALLAAVTDQELGEEQAEAVALLALVAGQDVEAGQRPRSWRIARRVATDRVISVVDPLARHTRKTNAQRRDGYRAHVATEPETGLATACALTAANLPDGPTGLELLAGGGAGVGGVGRQRLWIWADPRGAARRRPHPDDQADPPPERGAGRVHHPRLPHRPQAGMVRCPAGQVAPITSSGRVSFARPVPGLPAAPALHHCQLITCRSS